LPPASLQDEVRYLQPILTDRLFLQTGVELEDLVKDSEKLKLEEDPEYQKLMKEYEEKIELLQKS